MTLKVQGHDPDVLMAQYLENNLNIRCLKADMNAKLYEYVTRPIIPTPISAKISVCSLWS